jgi:hypothetical protein
LYKEFEVDLKLEDKNYHLCIPILFGIPLGITGHQRTSEIVNNSSTIKCLSKSQVHWKTSRGRLKDSDLWIRMIRDHLIRKLVRQSEKMLQKNHKCR